VWTTLIKSILNNVFVTMSADSKNSDKKWSFHLLQPKPHSQPNFRRRQLGVFMPQASGPLWISLYAEPMESMPG
jgi:hypothetical protein